MLEDIKGGSSKLDGCRPLAFIVFFREISFSTTIHPGNTLNIFIPLSIPIRPKTNITNLRIQQNSKVT